MLVSGKSTYRPSKRRGTGGEAGKQALKKISGLSADRESNYPKRRLPAENLRYLPCFHYKDERVPQTSYKEVATQTIAQHQDYRNSRKEQKKARKNEEEEEAIKMESKHSPTRRQSDGHQSVHAPAVAACSTSRLGLSRSADPLWPRPDERLAAAVRFASRESGALSTSQAIGDSANAQNSLNEAGKGNEVGKRAEPIQEVTQEPATEQQWSPVHPSGAQAKARNSARARARVQVAKHGTAWKQSVGANDGGHARPQHSPP